MKRGSEHTKRVRQILAPLLGSALIAYFAYHMVQGDRGLMTWWQLRYQIEAADAELDQVRAKRDRLNQRITLLRPESLDPDMLDEQTRSVLALADRQDFMIIPN